MITSVLRFDPEGTGHCLYTEAIELSTIGPLEVRRASTIEFNAADQRWEVRKTTEECIFSHRLRSVCVAWELQYFNR